MNKKIKEEFGGMVGGSPITNVVGGGQIAGLGVGPQGEPGVKPRKKRKSYHLQYSQESHQLNDTMVIEFLD